MSEENSLAKQNSAIEFRPRKLKALQGLKDDLGVVKAAKFAGISRTTLYRWMTSDPVFIAELNGWKGRKLAAVDAILIAGAPTAARRLVKAARLDSKAAAVLLKGVGALNGKSVGSTDPDEVQQEHLLAEEQRRVNREAKKQKLLDQQLKVFAQKRVRETQLGLLPAPGANDTKAPTPVAGSQSPPAATPSAPMPETKPVAEGSPPASATTDEDDEE